MAQHATIMVIVAAIALGSSTYAWFVTNGTVTADNMKVQAVAENGLEIKTTLGSASEWASAAHGIHGTAAGLIPTSTVYTNDWYHASALAKGASTVNLYTMEKLNIYTESETSYVGKTTTDTDAKGYYIHDQFHIRSTNSVAKNLQIASLTITAPGDTLSPGLRVAVKVNGATYICAPVSGATMTYEVGTSGSRTSVTAISSSDLCEKVLYAEVPADNTGVPVDVYVYFEGEDAAIYTDNIPDSAIALSVTFEFSAEL